MHENLLAAARADIDSILFGDVKTLKSPFSADDKVGGSRWWQLLCTKERIGEIEVVVSKATSPEHAIPTVAHIRKIG